MDVLITGGTGLLGKYLLATKPEDVRAYATYHRYWVPGVEYKLELRDRDSIHYLFERTRPDVVIHTAGQGSVDICERDFTQYYNVNIGGAYRIMEECSQHGAKFVGISTNAVFKGDAAPYDDDDELDPINMYGHSKVCMEMATNHYFKDGGWLIIRPILMYGWPNEDGRKNWANIVDEALRSGKRLKIVSDTRTQPLYARDCAEFIWQVILDGRSGTYNVAGASRLSLYEFTREVARVFGHDPGMIEPVTSDTFPNIAPRPKDTTYTLRRMIQDGYMPGSLGIGLERMRMERYG